MLLNGFGVLATQVQAVDAHDPTCTDQYRPLSILLCKWVLEVIRIDLFLGGGLEATVRALLLAHQDRLVVLLDWNTRIVVLVPIEVDLVLSKLLVDLVTESLVQVVHLAAVGGEATDQVANLGGASLDEASLVHLGADGWIALDDDRVVDVLVHVLERLLDVDVLVKDAVVDVRQVEFVV
jgi:hypothetical protein